jgi:hypothetical protein
MVMRFFAHTILALMLILIASVTSPQAQMLPLNMALDSSFGIEYLFGRQDLRHTYSPVGPFQDVRTRWDPRLAVLAGTVEVTPAPFASGRIGGAVSVAGNNVEVIRDTGALPDLFRWKLHSDFNSWEAAGLYHLWNGGGYRFSVTGGYRRETWLYKGDPRSPHTTEASLRDEFTANIPFVGLQTSMHFPWWKARFEVLGSWFVTKTFHQTVNQRHAVEVHDGEGDQGGVLLFQMEGTCHVTPNILLGLHGRYSYQEFKGRSTFTSTFPGAPLSGYGFYLIENLGAAGVNVTVVF